MTYAITLSDFNKNGTKRLGTELDYSDLNSCIAHCGSPYEPYPSDYLLCVDACKRTVPPRQVPVFGPDYMQDGDLIRIVDAGDSPAGPGMIDLCLHTSKKGMWWKGLLLLNPNTGNWYWLESFDGNYSETIHADAWINQNSLLVFAKQQPGLGGKQQMYRLPFGELNNYFGRSIIFEWWDDNGVWPW